MQPQFTIIDFPTGFKTYTYNTGKQQFDYLLLKLKEHKGIKRLPTGFEKAVRALAERDSLVGVFYADKLENLTNKVYEELEKNKDANASEKTKKKRKTVATQKNQINAIKASKDKAKIDIGLKMQQSSFKKMKQFVDEFRARDAFKNNVETLQNSKSYTDDNWIRHTLATGNKFQSMLAFSQSQLDKNTRSVNLDDTGFNLKNLGWVGLPKKYSSRPNPRLYTAMMPGRNAGAYEKGKVMPNERSLEALEMMRFFQLVLSHSLRKTLKRENNTIDEHDPTGDMTLYEVQDASGGQYDVRLLFSNNSANIYNRIKSLSPDVKLGKHHAKFPGKTAATVESFTNAFDALIKKHNKDTQNAFHREVFRIVRAEIGPLKDEGKNDIIINTPSPSPRNSFDSYEESSDSS